jgi:hypothetical protein
MLGLCATEMRRRASRARTSCSWASISPSPSLAALPTAIHQVKLKICYYHRMFLMCFTDFNGVDGIIGFGLPVAHPPPPPPAPPASMFGGMQVSYPHFNTHHSKPHACHTCAVPLRSCRRRGYSRDTARASPLRPHGSKSCSGRKQPPHAPASVLLLFNRRCRRSSVRWLRSRQVFFFHRSNACL